MIFVVADQSTTTITYLPSFFRQKSSSDTTYLAIWKRKSEALGWENMCGMGEWA